MIKRGEGWEERIAVIKIIILVVVVILACNYIYMETETFQQKSKYTINSNNRSYEIHINRLISMKRCIVHTRVLCNCSNKNINVNNNNTTDNSEP